MKRGILGIVLVASLAAGCAGTGADAGAGSRADGGAPGARGDAGPPSARFAEELATCVQRSPQPGPDAVRPTIAQGSPAGRPGASVRAPAAHALEALRHANDELRRAYAPEKSFFRDRRPLAADWQTANQPCADTVIKDLTLLRAQNRYDADSVTLILGRAGLTRITVRPAGRPDPPGSGALVFAGWTGAACVFGEYGPDRLTAGVGGVVSGGGCLPA